MPTLTRLRQCNEPGCSRLQDAPRCDEHTRDRTRAYNAARGSSTRQGYGSSWEKLRAIVLADQPLCVMCQEEGRLTPATEVDHRIPRERGGTDELENLQGLCKHHHSRKTALQDGRWRRRT